MLGGGVEPDGSLPYMARARAARGVELFKAGIAPRLIMSGRCGLNDPEPAVTEAAAMAAYARAHGVPDDALFLEEAARDTLGNAFFTRELFLEPNNWRSIRVVTSDFHLSRAAWVFRKILGARYDFSFISSGSGLPPRELILRALEECKLTIFLNEWLAAVEEGDDDAIDNLMERDHPGYADAPTLSHDEMRTRLAEIANINQIAGTQHWITHGTPPQPQIPQPTPSGRRKADRRKS
ncbi:MAG TPA: YdcF family protein [Longimicrobiales bacterium]